MNVISPQAQLTIAHLPIRRLVIAETRIRSLDWVAHYTRLLLDRPDWDTGLLCVEPRGDGYYTVVDGQTRYLAHIIAGRASALCLIITEGGE